MARSGSDFRGWYWWALVVTSVLVPFVAIAAVVFLISQGRENADQWASIFSFVITGLVAAAAMIGWLRQRAKSRGDLGTLDVAEPEADAVAACAERLAAGVERAWRTEELRQRLLDPEPMPVAWRTLGPPVTDHWRVIGGGDTPIDLDGSLNDSYDVVRTRLPKGRLVVLGEPGGGKTSLMVRFVLDALAAREPSDPVPVILRLSTWEPSEQPISRVRTPTSCSPSRPGTRSRPIFSPGWFPPSTRVRMSRTSPAGIRASRQAGCPFSRGTSAGSPSPCRG
ncbi:hypothetical protein ACFMQL_38055 [Nonomuraea fastidiosa]|uniref:hypothetical protein n=2 Tax=Nonomuraea TaxID=83681 RepID=UPI003671F3C2